MSKMKRAGVAFMSAAMSISMMVSPIMAKTDPLVPYTGWKTKGKKRYYYENDTRLTGFHKIGKKFYYFDRKSGAMKTGTVKAKGVTYYLKKNGVMKVRKQGSDYFNSKNQRVGYWDGYEFATIQRAKKIISQITTKKMSRSKKLLKCFKWVQHFYYKTPRKFNYKKGWTAVYANDHLKDKGAGDCHSDACAFAYLAYALGYKKVYVASDSKNPRLEVHSFTEINGRVFDPLFATTYGMKTNYNASYRAYRDGKATRQKIPYATFKAVGKQKKFKEKKIKIKTGWNPKTKRFVLANGHYASGVIYEPKNGKDGSKKFYAFYKKGHYNASLTKKLRAADRYKNPIAKIESLLGKPNKTHYSATCLDDNGKDGLWYYDHVVISTHKTPDGKEYYMGASKK